MMNKNMMQDIDLLNENGKNLVDLKNVLLENKKNPFIYKGLLSSIKPEDFEETIYKKLTDDNVKEEEFKSLLITLNKYANYTDFQKKLSYSLEKKGLKYFTIEESIKDSGVVVIRKFGISIASIRREFRLTESEAGKLHKDGFIETYAKLKLKAQLKDMVKKVKKQCKIDNFIRLETSKFYYNKKNEVYNIDFRIIITVSEDQFKNSALAFNLLVNKIENILKFLEKEYYQN